MLAEGTEAPDFELKDLDGAAWSLAEARTAGPVLLVFFKISCPTCQFTMPFLQRLAEVDRLQVVAVSQDEAAGTLQFQKRFQVSMRTLLDKAWSFAVSNAFRISHVPSLFLVETDGRIGLAVEGFSRKHIERLGELCGVAPFAAGEAVPALRPG